MPPDEPEPGAPTEKQRLGDLLEAAATTVAALQDSSTWLLRDPEWRKALSRARQFLLGIDERLDAPGRAPVDDAVIAAAEALLRRLAEKTAWRGRENAWDRAEELRVTRFAFLPDEALLCELEHEQLDTSSLRWEVVFPKKTLDRLLAEPAPPDFRVQALEHLRALHAERIDRVLHDRAREKIWQQFAWKLGGVLYVLLFLLYLKSPTFKWEPVVAGAVGSMLSGAIKLREAEQRIRQLRRGVTYLLVQPVVGATAACVLTWLGPEQILSIKPPNLAALVGFLAGFSEPFFLGTIARITDAAPASDKAEPPREKRHG